MIKNIWNKPIKRFTLIVLVSCILSFILYGPFLYQFITKGIVFSGSGDGFRQMMPFQMYLYEHFTSLKGFYDGVMLVEPFKGKKVCDIKKLAQKKPTKETSFILILELLVMLTMARPH